MHFAFPLILLALESATLAHAALFFLQPASGSSCTGGSPCTVSWEDDGNSPLLGAIGVVTAALYTGEMQLVQTLAPIDVANVLSYKFTPIPGAGPNSDTYYIAFTSTSDKVNGTSYVGFSPFFTLNGMSGSFASPLSTATASISVAASLTKQSGTILPTTITIGSIDTSESLATFVPSTSAKPKSSSSSSSTSTPATSRFATTSIPPSSSVAPASAVGTSSAASRFILPWRLLLLSLCAFLFIS
ncbi:hypothetical protein HMN09_00174000 [Mycena chlorophos]|uniref:Yeast cell wall synthesis Kre9/Knh1-like N-terminal domain-containing protein n=1 Tax=Mycena chlorophos TaxID=658473 RepID=A0A8H6WQJ2_MYCCL|nr:hypothetical protein HMN09_00174000 [Mycena chlorophos]